MKSLEVKPRLGFMIAALLCGCASAPVSRSAASPPIAPAAQTSETLPPLPPKWEVTDRVLFKTTLGEFTVGLYGKDAPNTVANFLVYVDSGFYTNKVFHRIIPGFMIQGGGFDPSLVKAETKPSIKLELVPGLKHEPGIVSMARTQETSSATSQFFVCVSQSPQLNGLYAAFGKIENGYDVAVAISEVSTETKATAHGSMEDVPVKPVVIEWAKRL